MSEGPEVGGWASKVNQRKITGPKEQRVRRHPSQAQLSQRLMIPMLHDGQGEYHGKNRTLLIPRPSTRIGAVPTCQTLVTPASPRG
jgi:hypothetical protein